MGDTRKISDNLSTLGVHAFMINLEKTLRVGNEVRFKCGEAGFITVICDIINNNILKIMLPTNSKESVIIYRGEKYNVICVNEKAMYMLETIVKDVYALHEVMVLELEALSNTKIQRRDAFRVNENVKVKYRIIFSETIPLETWKTTRTVDLSETGMQIRTETPLTLGQQLEITMDIDTLGIRETLTDIKAKVVRCSNKQKAYFLGIKFENISKKAKDTIIKLVVLSQRNKLSYHNNNKR